MAFGHVVARRRRALGYSLRALGARAGVSANTVRNVERGAMNARLDIMAQVARGLGVPLWRMMRAAERRLGAP